MFEQYYPLTLGSLFGIIAGCRFPLHHIVEGGVLENAFDSILSSIIGFSSVSVGFVGVLLAVLFSIKDGSKMIGILFESWPKRRLKGYFKYTILSLFVLILISMLLYTRNYLPNLNLFFSVWIALLVYSLLSTYRLVGIMMHVIFNKDIKPPSHQSLSLDPERKEALKKKCAE